MVFRLLSAEQPDSMRLKGLSRVKFRKIVRPGELLDIHAAPGNKQGHYIFRITSGDEEVCSGQMIFSNNAQL